MTRAAGRIARRAMLTGVITVVALFAASHVGFAATAGGVGCWATTVTNPPNHTAGLWLDIHGSGLAPNKTYSVFAVTPAGYTEGVAVWVDSSGTFETTSLPAPQPGSYQISIDRFHTNSALAGCTLTVP